MSIASASRKSSSSDLFRTPVEMLVPLVMATQNRKHVKILDPCEGDGRIKRALMAPSRSVIGFDLEPDYGVSVDFLKHQGRYDMIIGNPPFSLKKEFITHALELAGTVIFLLPMSVVSYNEFHREFLDRPEYVGRILMTPKLFLNEAGTWKPGGINSYAWFFWDKSHSSRGSFEFYFDLRKVRRNNEKVSK